MEEDHTSNMEGSGTEQSKSMKETFKSGSPDDVRERVKDVVEKGVAAVAGALRGFNKEVERSEIPEQTKGAIHQAAQTTKSTVASVTEEAKGLKEPLREAGQKLGETARELRGTLKDEVDRTKGAVRDAGTEGSGSERPELGMGGSELSSSGSAPSTGLGRGEMPDIRNTPLAKSDKELQGKDLTPSEDEP